jgi:hypothetical protein
VKKGEETTHPILRKGFETLQDESSSLDEWRYMGVKLFKKKFYQAAITCF